MATDALSHAPRDAARVDALRERVFTELAERTARYRLYWAAPFSLAVLVLLMVRGQPVERVVVQACATASFVAAFIWGAARPKASQTRPAFSVIVTLSSLASIANTGGVASPLLMTLLPATVGGALCMTSWQRKTAFIGCVTAALLGMMITGSTDALRLVAPLVPQAGHASVEYLVLAGAAAIYSVLVLAFMAESMALAHQRVALELAARREELCSEADDRTMALEAIAARLSHEVKNPLAAIKGLSTHMARRVEDPKLKERMEIVASEADRLQSIVDGFLSFSRGFDDLRIAPVEPFAVAKELCLLLEQRAAEASVKLRVTGNEDVSISADGRKLRQALLNIVVNAIQASKPGSTVTIEVGRGPGDAALLRIIDEGEGMSADVLERIKKPYFTTKEGGTGLGLAVARGVIEQHNGLMRIESAVGKGTTVTIDFPSISFTVAAQKALPNPLRQGGAATLCERKVRADGKPSVEYTATADSNPLAEGKPRGAHT